MVTLSESFIFLALNFLESAVCPVFQGTSTAIVLDILDLVDFCSLQQHSADILFKLTNSNFTFT